MQFNYLLPMYIYMNTFHIQQKPYILVNSAGGHRLQLSYSLQDTNHVSTNLSNWETS